MSHLLLPGAADLSEAAWQELATGGDPFVSRAFLGVAERTGAATEALGYKPPASRLGGNNLLQLNS